MSFSNEPGRLITLTQTFSGSGATLPAIRNAARTLLIPTGSRLVGSTSAVNVGAERVEVAWNNLVYPSGRTVPLDPPWLVSDTSGAAGITGKVDRHFWRNLGNAIALGGVGAGLQLSQPQTTRGENYSGREVAAGEIGRQVGTLGTEYASQGLDMAPTITVGKGKRFVIILPDAVELPPAT